MPNSKRYKKANQVPNNQKLNQVQSQYSGNQILNNLSASYDNFTTKLNFTPLQKKILPYFSIGFVAVLSVFIFTISLIMNSGSSKIAYASCPVGFSTYQNGCISSYMKGAIDKGYKGPISEAQVNCFLVGLNTSNGCDANGNIKRSCDSLTDYITNGEYFDPYTDKTLICE